MIPILYRTGLRHALRSWQQTLLALLGVMLGVALMVGVDTANASARRAFGLSVNGITGTTTHIITSNSGSVPDSLYAALRRKGIRSIAPVIEQYVTVPGRSKAALRLLGIDPFATQIRGALGADAGTELPLKALLTVPGACLIAKPTAQRLGLALQDTFTITTGGSSFRMKLAGEVEVQDENLRQQTDNLLVADIATAQEISQLSHAISYIEVTETDTTILGQISAMLPVGTILERAAARTARMEEMTRAFSLNLTALSLLALLVGMLLIYNTATFSVLQRFTMLGTLRAIGVTQGQVQRMLLAEAATVATIGSALGVLVGYALGGLLTRLVSQSINDLYFVVNVLNAPLSFWTILKGMGFGIGAAVVSTWLPAREAASIPPRAVMQRSRTEQRVKQQAWLRLLSAVVMAAVATVCFWFPTGVAGGYLGLLAVIAAVALLTPWLIKFIMLGVTPLAQLGFGLLGRMAAREITATLSRTGVAIAALSVAVAATIGVGVMVGSFRKTVSVWLTGALDAHIFISPPSLTARRNDATLLPKADSLIHAHPGIAHVASIRSKVISYQDRTAQLVAIGGYIVPGPRFQFVQGDPAQHLQALKRGEVFVSEPFALRFQVKQNDSLALATPLGVKQFRIAAIEYDYGSDLGVIFMHDSTYLACYRDTATSGLGLYVQTGFDKEEVVRELQAATAPFQQLNIRSNATLLQTSLEVFDRTFTITYALQLLTLLVAFVGVLSALLALQLEQARTYATLRATVLTPGQLRKLIVMNTSFMGLVAGILAVPLGIGLAYGLVNVINLRSFGWSLQFTIDPLILIQAFVLSIGAAALAGFYPAWRLSKLNPATALRDE